MHTMTRRTATFTGAVLASLVLIIGLPQVEAHADPYLDVPSMVLNHSTPVGHGTGGGPHYIIDFDDDYAYADGGVTLMFDNGLGLAFLPRYQERGKCWVNGAYDRDCSREVMHAYQWKREQLREITLDWQPCLSDGVDDTVSCVWDARHQGNGQGRSFKVDRGHLVYVSHARAEWLLGL